MPKTAANLEPAVRSGENLVQIPHGKVSEQHIRTADGCHDLRSVSKVPSNRAEFRYAMLAETYSHAEDSSTNQYLLQSLHIEK